MRPLDIVPLLLALALTVGCMKGGDPAVAHDEEAAPAASTSNAAADAAAQQPVTRTLTGEVHPDLPPFTFTVHADSSDVEGCIAVRTVEVRRGEARVQTVEGLDTETPWTDEYVGLELQDVDFDGYADLRIVAFVPAGPNVPYLNWRYDPVAARFERFEALDALAAPVFDAGTRTVTSEWRSGAATYGTDTYRYEGRDLVLVRQEVRTARDDGAFDVVVHERVGGEMQVVSETVEATAGAAGAGGPDFEAAGLDEAAAAAFLAALQEAVAAGDRAAVAAMAAYPLRAGDATIRSAADFVARYDDVVTGTVRTAVLAQQPGDLFVNWQGAMVGDGVLWFGGVLVDDGFALRITSLNP